MEKLKNTAEDALEALAISMELLR